MGAGVCFAAKSFTAITEIVRVKVWMSECVGATGILESSLLETVRGKMGVAIRVCRSQGHHSLIRDCQG